MEHPEDIREDDEIESEPDFICATCPNVDVCWDFGCGRKIGIAGYEDVDYEL